MCVLPVCFVYWLIATPKNNENTIHGTILPLAIEPITLVGMKFNNVSDKELGYGIYKELSQLNYKGDDS